jgi:Spy/CpxP family protein refolding chaperone
MKHIGKLLTLLAALVLFPSVTSIHAQAIQQQSGSSEAQQAVADPIQQLNLAPEQREQIRAIREENRTERAALNARVREANRLLQAELDVDNPDEALVDQRVRELGIAQAAAMRMRILTEIRIRRVLTPEQRNILKSLQQQAQELRRERLLTNPLRQQRQAERRALQNQRNGIKPLQNQRRQRL